MPAASADQERINLHGNESLGTRGEKVGERTASGADLHDRLAGAWPHGVDNTFQRVPIGEEVLAQPLTGGGE